MNPYYDPRKRHHRPYGFQNNYTPFEPKSFADVRRWRRDARQRGLPPPPSTPIPEVAADVGLLHANAGRGEHMEPTVTWIGHATVLAQLGGLTMITDPMFSPRASPLSFIGPRRQRPPGMALVQLPHVDLVAISHNHYDHLDARSVDHLNRQNGGPPLFIVPLGLKPWLGRRGISNAVELDWWQRHEFSAPKGNVEVTLVPAQHWSARGLTDRMATLWGGFAVLASDCHLFYAGDTGYSSDFSDIRSHFAERQTASVGGGFDIALIPIGSYEPRWFMSVQHVNPREAVQIHRDIGAKRSLGVHWGTFQLTDEALDVPPQALAEARRDMQLREDEFFTLALGETRKIAPRSTQATSS